MSKTVEGPSPVRLPFEPPRPALPDAIRASLTGASLAPAAGWGTRRRREITEIVSRSLRGQSPRVAPIDAPFQSRPASRILRVEPASYIADVPMWGG
jgi:hypothetical protein